MVCLLMPTTRLRPLFALLALVLIGGLPACSSSDDVETTPITLAIDVAADLVWAERPVTLRALVAGEGVAQDVTFRWSFGDGERAEGTTVTHEWPFAGDFDVRVEARQDDTLIAEGNLTLEVLEPANLVVAPPGAAPVNLDSDLRLQADTTVRNRGGATRLGVDVVLYAASSSVASRLDATDPEALEAALAADEIFVLAETTLDPLDAESGERAVRFSDVAFPPDTPTGTYRLIVRADPAETFGDADRATNAAIGSQTLTFNNRTSTGPVLAVRSVSARPARTNLLNAVTFGAIIANVGNEPALFLRWDATLEGPDGRTWPLASGDIANLPPRSELDIEETRVTLDEPIADVGQYNVRVVASFTRGDGSSAEARSTPINVTDEAVAGVDIAALSLVLNPTTSFIGGTVELTATIANLGTEDVPSSFFCRVQLTDSDVPEPSRDVTIDTFTIRSLAAGETREVVRLGAITTLIGPGLWTPYLVCDPSFRVADTDRDNNLVRADEPLIVNEDAEIDLVVTAVDVDRNTADDGTRVTFSVEVCNEGSNTSTPAIVRVHQAPENRFDRNHTIAAEATLPPLEPNRCRTLEIEATARCDTFRSEYTLFAEADATDLVPDINRANNVRMRSEPWTITGPICSCTPDTFAPNHTVGSAAPLDPDRRQFNNLTMCTSHIDWYRIPLLAGETVRAVITFANDRGNLDLTLYSTDASTVLASSATSRDLEEVSYAVVPRRGDYFLKVQGRTPDDRNLYSLELSVSAQEPGTDLTVLNVRVEPSTLLPGARADVRYDLVNLGDTPAGTHVNRFWLSRNTTLDPEEDLLLREESIALLDGRTPRTTAITLPDNIEGGPWHVIVQVDARDDVDELDTNNNTGVSPTITVDDRCMDPFEPNNTLGEPTTLELDGDSPVRFEGLRACTGNPDFYRICGTAGDTFSARIDFDSADGDLDMRLYDATGRVIQRSEGLGNTESVGVEFLTSNTCHVAEIYTVGPDRNVPYALTVTLEPAPPELACNRNAEPNASFATGAPLRDWLNRDLALCPAGDVDYYRIELPAGREVTFRLEPTEDEPLPNTLRLSLWGPSQNFLTTTVSATEPLRWTPAFAGNYGLRVISAGTGQRAQPYRIRVEGLDGIDLQPLELRAQPNTITPGDPLRYTFSYQNGGALPAGPFAWGLYVADAPFVTEDAILLGQFEDAGLDPFTSRTVTGTRTLPHGLEAGQDVWLVARLDDRSELAELDPSNNTLATPLTLLERCLPDAAEPNGVYLDAAPLNDFIDAPLTLCTGESDWFRISLSPGQTFTLQARFDQHSEDIDLIALDPELQPIGNVTRNDDTLTLTLTAARTGTHRIEISSFDPSIQTGYVLQRP